MIDSQDDFFVTGKVIDYLNYKSYIDNKDTCSSAIQSKLDVEAGYKGNDENSQNQYYGVGSFEDASNGKRKENFRAGFYNSDGNGN